MQQQASRMTEMQTELTEQKLNISEQKRELQLLKVRVNFYINIPKTIWYPIMGDIIELSKSLC